MYKLNLVLMVVLTLALIGGMGYLCLHSSESEAQETAETQKLLRKLADRDPDIRRDGERELKALGPRAVEILAEASRSADPVLAERASKLLTQIRPAVAETPSLSTHPEEASALADEQLLELIIECPERRVGVGRPVPFYVRLRNNGPVAVAVARERLGGYGRFAGFEVSDGKGAFREFGLDAAAPGKSTAEFVTVTPGETLDLFAGTGDGRACLESGLGKTGTWKVRFAYDASEGSAYRKVLTDTPEASPLPLARLLSNAVDIEVVD